MNVNFHDAIGNIIGQTPAPTLAAIRAPHFIPESLLANHWGLWILMLVFGGAMFFRALQVGRPRAQLVGAAVVILVGLWILLATVVFVTPAKRLEAAHRRILSAAQAKNIAGVMNNLSADFRWGPITKEAMPVVVRTALDYTGIKSYHLDNYQADIEGDQALTQGHVTIYTDSGQVLTAWHLRWQDDPAADWELVAVDKWAVGGQEMPPGIPAGPAGLEH